MKKKAVVQSENIRINRDICSVVLKPYCSNHCIFCRLPDEDSRLSAQGLDKMEQDAYAAIDEFRKAGYSRIEVSGGDPLEYNQLAKYIQDLRYAGFEWIRISTNGVRLADRKFSKKLLEAGVNLFRIPLYGPSAEIHDAVTRIPGSFEATVQGIRNLKELGGTEILLTSLLLKQNARYLTQTFDLMCSLHYDDAYFSPVFISNGDYTYYVPYKQQGFFFGRLLRHALRSRRYVRLMDVPYCVVGLDHKLINNQQRPAHLASGFETPLNQRTSVPDLPKYRRKIKVERCRKCAVAEKCDGFLVNDLLRYDIQGLKPISRGNLKAARGVVKKQWH